MINRRRFIAATSVVAAAGTIGVKISGAQVADLDLSFENASFIETASIATPTASPAATATLSDFHGYLLGDPDAAHTLQVYADYRCPHCRAFSADIEPQIIEEYVKPGKLKLEYIDFTVIGVPGFEDLVDDSIESVQAAEAAACAAEQGEYLAYRDWLFDGPMQTNEGDFSDENLIGAAVDLGLDEALFRESLSSGKFEQSIIASVSFGLEQGVQGTPAMVLDDGEAFYVPNNGFEGLKELFDSQIGE